MSAFIPTFDILDECSTKGKGIQLRLIQSHKTKALAIQSYGSMSKEWITSHRYGDIQAIWASSKALTERLNNRKK